MSQALLRLWNPDHPRRMPKTVQDAERIFRRLIETPAPPEPKFLALLTPLLQKWPSRRVLSERGDDPRTSVWSGWNDSPLLHLEALETACFNLVVTCDHGMQVFVDTIKAAQQAGLVAFDDSNERLWLPDGTVLPEEQAVKWAGLVNQVCKYPVSITQTEAARDLVARLNPLMQPEGWKFHGAWRDLFCSRFVASTGLTQRINLSNESLGGDPLYGVKWSISMRFQSFDRAVEMLREQYPQECKSLSRAFLSNGLWTGGMRSLLAAFTDFADQEVEWLPIDTAAQRQQIVDKLRDQILPLINNCPTPKSLNALMDSGEIKRYLPGWQGDPESPDFPKSSSDSFLYALFFAWMNKSPRVPKLAARCRQEIEKMAGLLRLLPSDWPDDRADKERFIAFTLSHEPPDVGQFAD